MGPPRASYLSSCRRDTSCRDKWKGFFSNFLLLFAEKFLCPFSWPAPDLMCQRINQVCSYFLASVSNVFCLQLHKTLHVWTSAYEYNADFELSLAQCVPLELEPLLHPHNPSASPFCVHLSFFKVTAVSQHLGTHACTHPHTHTHTHTHTHIQIYIYTHYWALSLLSLPG